jgi:hypothetical protein
MIVPPVCLLRARDGWLEALRQPAVQEDWDEFRRDMRAQSGRDAPVAGPVKRKEPRSPEPPLLVWLRDHLALAIVAWMLFGSVLFAFLGGAILGLLAQDQPRRRGDHEKQHAGDGEHAQQ